MYIRTTCSNLGSKRAGVVNKDNHISEGTLEMHSQEEATWKHKGEMQEFYLHIFKD